LADRPDELAFLDRRTSDRPDELSSRSMGFRLQYERYAKISTRSSV